MKIKERLKKKEYKKSVWLHLQCLGFYLERGTEGPQTGLLSEGILVLSMLSILLQGMYSRIYLQKV